MPLVLICAPSLQRELSHTLLWRKGVERHQATSLEQALTIANAIQPELTVVDRRLPGAAQFVATLRSAPRTRQTSVAVVAVGDFEPEELELLDAGANAILRLPVNGQWDSRLYRLLSIPTRRDARFELDFTVEGTIDSGPLTGSALNLSAHGLLLHTRTPLSVGDWLTFAFRIPGAFIDGRGRIVRQAGAGTWGIVFEQLTGNAGEYIESYIAALGTSRE